MPKLNQKNQKNTDATALFIRGNSKMSEKRSIKEFLQEKIVAPSKEIYRRLEPKTGEPMSKGREGVREFIARKTEGLSEHPELIPSMLKIKAGGALTGLNVKRKAWEIEKKSERFQAEQQQKQHKTKFDNMLAEAQMKAQIEASIARQYAPPQQQVRRLPRRGGSFINAPFMQDDPFSASSPFDNRDPFSIQNGNPFTGKKQKRIKQKRIKSRNFLNDKNPFGL